METRPTPEQVKTIAALTNCQPNTIARYFSGFSIYSSTRERIERALNSMGATNLIRTEPPVEYRSQSSVPKVTA